MGFIFFLNSISQGMCLYRMIWRKFHYNGVTFQCNNHYELIFILSRGDAEYFLASPLDNMNINSQTHQKAIVTPVKAKHLRVSRE